MMSKDQWIADVERVIEEYLAEKIDFDDAVEELTASSIGLTPAEARKELEECKL